MMSIKKIGIIGSGTMGNGIAHVSALHGFQTVLLDLNQTILNVAFNKITNNLNRQLEKGAIKRVELERALTRVRLSTEYHDLHDCDVLIEAASEDKITKKKIFKSMDEFSKIDAILASNTSSISITELADVTKKPHKVIGMHFMNPVPIMQLVEVIKGEKTDRESLDLIKKLSIKLNKQPIECNDSPGFISNRILMPMINEAILTLEEGVSGVEEIDTVMILGMSHPMGPLFLADFIGLDVCLSILEVMQDGFNDKKYKPSELLVSLVNEGRLGVKSGEGFYNYKDGLREKIVSDKFKR